MLTVVKVGGSTVEGVEDMSRAIRAVSRLPGRRIVVHGGGGEISIWQDRAGIPVAWKDGLRVTTPESLQVASMVLSGWINKRIVSALVEEGEMAVGISGEDGGLLQARHKDGGRLGEVGSVTSVNPRILRTLLAAGILPVVSPISRGPSGDPLNVNGDEAALALALEMKAARLLLVSDVAGVEHDGEALATLSEDEARALVEAGAISGGMRVKVAQALRGAAAGMEVRIGDSEILRNPDAGTRFGARKPSLGIVG